MLNFGCLPDPKDARDYKAAVKLAERPIALAAMPTFVDFRVKGFCPPIRDQENLGSCVAFACLYMREFILRKQILTLVAQENIPHLSPLYLYYKCREWMQANGFGSIDQDGGTWVRLGMDRLANVGCLTEAEWPYVCTDFALTPPDDHGGRFKLHTYWRAESLDDIKQALAQEFGVVLAVNVYDNMAGPLGAVPIPGGGWLMPVSGSQLVGLHGLFLAGYQDDPQNPKAAGGGWLLVANQWNTTWGLGGFAWMPYQYILDGLWSDAWVGVA